jgi:SAM-dependent methyltransferase
MTRPFYGEYAWAFDLLVDRPVRKESGVIVDWLVERQVLPGAQVLDAGCGTGRYAIELARRGYAVHGIDLSPQLIDVAIQSSEDAKACVSFAVGDICDPLPNVYDAILCRGVLNDIVEDEERDTVFARFAGALRPCGVLVLDVREWGASVERKAHEPLFRKRVFTDRGELTFTSMTAVDRSKRQLRLAERHALVHRGEEHVVEYEFVMRCWERGELDAVLVQHGFGDVRYFGAYDADVEAGATDRLVTVARRAGKR